jgi:ABC-2 type transport system permease protein
MVDMSKLLAIAWNHIRIEFEDRSTIVFYLILPLLFTVIVGAALGGKVSGIFLTGLAQMVILIAFSALAFGVRWGAPVALIVLIVATVFAATGWGALIAAYAKSPGQAMSIGSMMALVFAGLAGNFVPRQNYPQFLQQISLVTPNAWALEGFQSLGQGGGLSDVLLPIVALTLMGAILFGVATALFRRQYR